MYSVDDVASFESVEETMYHLRHDLGSDRPFILVANKIDLVRNRKVSPEGKLFSCKNRKMATTQRRDK